MEKLPTTGKNRRFLITGTLSFVADILAIAQFSYALASGTVTEQNYIYYMAAIVVAWIFLLYSWFALSWYRIQSYAISYIKLWMDDGQSMHNMVHPGTGWDGIIARGVAGIGVLISFLGWPLFSITEFLLERNHMSLIANDKINVSTLSGLEIFFYALPRWILMGSLGGFVLFAGIALLFPLNNPEFEYHRRKREMEISRLKIGKQ